MNSSLFHIYSLSTIVQFVVSSSLLQLCVCLCAYVLLWKGFCGFSCLLAVVCSSVLLMKRGSLPNYRFPLCGDDSGGGTFPFASSRPEHGKDAAFIVGVAGPTASGKTTVCERIVGELFPQSSQRVIIVSGDSFYRELSETERQHVANHNFDHPNALDTKLMHDTLRDLRLRRMVELPTYDFTAHGRGAEHVTACGPDVVLFESIFAFYTPELRDMMDLKVFVDTDPDTCLVRRIRRDMAQRGRSLESILTQYERFVKPSFEDFILPTKKYADMIIPRGSDNQVAISFIVDHIRGRLKEREQSLARNGHTHNFEDEDSE